MAAINIKQGMKEISKTETLCFDTLVGVAQAVRFHTITSTSSSKIVFMKYYIILVTNSKYSQIEWAGVQLITLSELSACGRNGKNITDG